MKKTVTVKGRAIGLARAIAYARDSIVSKTLLNRKAGTLTLFSFDAGQGLSEHTAPYDATLQVLDGGAEVTIGGRKLTLQTGEMVIMPARVPHAVHAHKRFKMLLIMIR